MNFKSHLIAGTATGAITGLTAWYITKNPVAGLSFASVTLIGSLASDVDTGSIPSRLFAWAGIILAAVLMWQGRDRYSSIVGIVYMAFSADKHRGFTHGWILPIVCFVCSYFAYIHKIPINFILLFPFAVGLLTHKAVDK